MAQEVTGTVSTFGGQARAHGGRRTVSPAPMPCSLCRLHASRASLERTGACKQAGGERARGPERCRSCKSQCRAGPLDPAHREPHQIWHVGPDGPPRRRAVRALQPAQGRSRLKGGLGGGRSRAAAGQGTTRLGRGVCGVVFVGSRGHALGVHAWRMAEWNGRWKMQAAVLLCRRPPV